MIIEATSLQHTRSDDEIISSPHHAAADFASSE